MTTTVSRAAILVALLATVGCGKRAVPSTAASPTPIPVATGDYPEYGYAPDLSWLAGRIDTAMRGGPCTYLTFSTHAGVAWGGKFALRGTPGSLDRLRAGDMVIVRGSVKRKASRECGALDFDVSSIEMH